ncbi:hypothetical protein L3X38_045304 [Prunus dulcis]|uniref:Uncharacterized protein n=1 Tax=Prunus dulcis TaxID=3755 RepID=A0AAD4V0M0_PRUDU|nr:hypothetical protein L3X38_045304 [Prunus dulcis]
MVKGTKKSSVDVVGSNKIAKNQNGKRSSLTNVDVDKASFHGSEIILEEAKLRVRSRTLLKCSTKKFCANPHMMVTLEARDLKRRRKALSEQRMKRMNEDLKQLEKEYCEAKTASYVLSNAPGQDVSASSSG